MKIDLSNGSVVVLLKRQKTGVDVYNNDVYATVPFGMPLRGAFAPGGSGEITNRMDQVVTQPTLYLTVRIDLSAIDALNVDGVTWEVDGDPLIWENPFTGAFFGMQIPLRKVT